MVDLVGTCPKTGWRAWIEEGDAAGDPATGAEWGWYTHDPLALAIGVGDRFYIVGHGRLRGWAPVVRLGQEVGGGWIIWGIIYLTPSPFSAIIRPESEE